MSQHSIDLLPDQIRVRSQYRVMAGRYVIAIVSVVALIVIGATHSRVRLAHVRQQLDEAQQRAELVISGEVQVSALRTQLRQQQQFIQRYEHIALPLEMSQVLATLVNELPVNVTLDHLDLVIGARRSARSARSRSSGNETGPLPRVLSGELRGFAATDADIAEIVTRLESRPLFEQVSLDFSRTRSVRERIAREFRVSFRIDLDRRYRVVEAPRFEAGEVGDVK